MGTRKPAFSEEANRRTEFTSRCHRYSRRTTLGATGLKLGSSKESRLKRFKLGQKQS